MIHIVSSISYFTYALYLMNFTCFGIKEAKKDGDAARRTMSNQWDGTTMVN